MSAERFHGSLADQLRAVFSPVDATPEQAELIRRMAALSAGHPDSRADDSGETDKVGG